ncbi:hypothetical protein BO221_38955 [Archangium sp. Cb G35]|uniref:hypothetical protein n=1 Tax=Archangium sp. Cb G35 TaxID=1920190 RepID=UPI000935AAA9|nr:hypothetical protein [Archangium sp. Cb G35]OJT18718.1 hypothetical protein BO221_38955 [Archangium sp. Cb G35]
MRNATSTEPSADSSADLQLVRQGCVELGRQAESIAELVVPLLRQATQELARLEAQRDELRRTGAPQQGVLPRLLERIDEHAQGVKRLERASRGLRELMTAVGGLSEQFQGALARREQEQQEQEAITREEKRMWLQELNSLREQVRGQGDPTAAAPAQQEELQRLRAENEAMPKLRAERDRLAHRVAELEKNLATREQTLTAKEQTIEDLRRMIVLLTGDAASTSAPSSPTSPKPVPAPASVVNLSTKVPPPPAMAPVPPKPRPAEPRQAEPKPADTMFGNSTMQLAHSMLETLGEEIEASPLTPPPVSSQPLAPERRVPSMEIMLEPLDDLEAPPRPSLPPPVPMVPPVPALSPAAAKAAALMPKASARVPPTGPALTPAPIPGMAPLPAAVRPGTLVISEDMFDEMLIEDSGKK